MSQHDFEIANQGFPSFRSDLNGGLQALASNSAGATEPSTTYAYQFWYDETTDILKMRNGDDDAWITLAFFDQTNDEWEVRSAVIQAVDSAGVVIKTDEGTTRVEIADDGSVTVNTSLDVDNIKIDGNTISSTDTNGDINITPDGTGKVVIDGLNYPTADGSDGQVLTTDGSGNIAFEDAAGGGITHASVFRLTTNQTANGTITNIEEVDDATYTSIGTPMTESSGIFTFPVTGIWQVTAQLTSNPNTNDTHNCFINVSTDSGSSYTNVARCSTGESGTRSNTGFAKTLIDCTNTSTFRVAFEVSSYSTGDIQGSTDYTVTGFTFIRLGDT